MDYEEYRDSFVKEVEEDSQISGNSFEDQYLDNTIAVLESFDELANSQRIYMDDTKCTRNRLMRVDGYSYSDADQTMTLFVKNIDSIADSSNITQKEIDDLYFRMFYFIDETLSGTFRNYLGNTEDSYKLAVLIRKYLSPTNSEEKNILKFRLLVVTNKMLSNRMANQSLLTDDKSARKKNGKIKRDEYNGIPVELEIWTLDRIIELDTSNRDEPVEIDFTSDFDDFRDYPGIPCLKGDIGENTGYEAYIAIIPGRLLADVYIEYGSKILEGNVRAFLGTKSAKGVNNGIKKTINNTPSKFFTYNNGIAVTAAEAELSCINGQLYITKVTDLQIINGGQTTASLAEAMLKRTTTLREIYVPMKLTVIPDRETKNEDGILVYDQMVKDIAKYANSQNKVTAADLFSNDPFHIWMERSSKMYLAPPTKYAIPTGWYYERARKKYNQEQLQLHGSALKRFQLKFPKDQVITKEQLAMYVTAMGDNTTQEGISRPWACARGKTWAMKSFGVSISSNFAKNKDVFNEYYFRKCICAAIIWRSIDRYLETNKKNPDFWYQPHGYKMDIIPYTIGKIMSCIPSGYSLNYSKIWAEQRLSDAFMREVEKLTRITNEFICDSGGVIVTEYCKRADTWIRFKDTVEYTPDPGFFQELVEMSSEKTAQKEAKKEQKELNELQVITSIISKGEEYWKDLLTRGSARRLLTVPEENALIQAAKYSKSKNIPMTSSGRIPTKYMQIIELILQTEDKLLAEGIVGTKNQEKVIQITDYSFR